MKEIFNNQNIVSELHGIFMSSGIEKIKVSVIVPTYNNEKYLVRCLISLIKQTLKEIEIIVINDGSTDRTKELLNEFSKTDCRIKVIHQENKKQGAARNEGLKIAEGEYIGYVDSDDWVDLDYFEKLYNNSGLQQVDDQTMPFQLAALENDVLKHDYSNDNNASRLSRLEQKLFNRTFPNDSDVQRMQRVLVAYEAKKDSYKYENNRKMQNMATMSQIGGILLMILAILL